MRILHVEFLSHFGEFPNLSDRWPLGPLTEGLHLKCILAKYLNFKNNLILHYKHQGRKTQLLINKIKIGWLQTLFTTLCEAAFRGF